MPNAHVNEKVGITNILMGVHLLDSILLKALRRLWKSNPTWRPSGLKRNTAQLAPLRRSFGATMQMGGIPPSEQIPLFVAGYTGWATMETIETHLAQNPNVAGILVIDSGLFASSAQFGGLRGTGPLALWALIAALHFITNSLQVASTNPLSYAT